MTVTLNPNQLRAHLDPIVALPEVSQITLIADEAGPAISKLATHVPPPWLVRVLGRAGAKLALCLVVARRERPDWVLGYNLLPHGVTTLLVGRLVRARTLFHMIGGPREWEGGGWSSDNRVVGRLRRPVPALERLLLLVIRRFTVVAVMGREGRDALVRRGVQGDRIVLLPASIDDRRFRPRPASEHEYQLITVSQLIPRKRLEDFIEAVARLRETRPALRAAIVGRGPAEGELRARAAELGVEDAVDFLGFREDVETLYDRSEVFVLPSRSEGLSIAMAEAMAGGLPAIVTDVGEARDLVRDGRNGFLFAIGDVSALVQHVGRVLDDPVLRRSLSDAAAGDARSLAGLDRITETNRGIFVTAPPAGPPRGLGPASRRRPRSTIVDRVEVVRGDVTSETLRRWGDLAVDRGNVFASPEWYFTWLRERPRERPFILIARDAGGQVVGILALTQSRVGPARLLRVAGGGLGDWFDLLCAPGDDVSVAAACAGALDDHHEDWHAILLEGVDRSARWPGALAGGWASPGVRAREWGRPTALPYIDLSERDFEGYLATRPSKVRSDVRRSVRRLQANGARFREVTEPADVAREMARFFELHDARWESAGGSAALNGESRRFHKRFAPLALRRGWLRLWFLDLEDRPVAGWYGYSIGGRYCFYLPGFDPAHEHLGVGTRLMIHTIERAASEGVSTYDFLSGDEDYKRRFETGRRFTHSLLITRRRHPAQPAAAGLAALIRAAQRLPAPLRSHGRRALGSVRPSA